MRDATTAPGSDDEAWEFTADVKRSIGPGSARLRLQQCLQQRWFNNAQPA